MARKSTIPKERLDRYAKGNTNGIRIHKSTKQKVKKSK